MPKNPKTSHLGSLNGFYQPKTSKKCKGVPLINFENFHKSRIVPKKAKRGTLWSHLYFWKPKKWFSERIEPTLSGFSKMVEVKQMNKF